ncbi:MAG TPA: 50S ribosomal protein L15 [Flavobacteriaceae bacterium]|nr:50S ribosomal protein L15 [Flavobacteriaceae bacterium]
MKLHNLKASDGAINRQGKRLGRGVPSGKGRTSTRGHKGAKSRSGYAKKIGFEGGQMPLQRRLPKFGFTNVNYREYQVVNLGRLQELVDENRISDKVDFDTMIEQRIATKNQMVKVLGGGELKAKLSVSAHKFTASAKKAIEDAGGEAIIL